MLKEINNVVEGIPDTQREPHIVLSYMARKAGECIEERDLEAALEVIKEIKEQIENILVDENTEKIMRQYIRTDDYSIIYQK